MIRKSVLLASVCAGAAVAVTAARAQVKEVEMVHWWTSGGEAAALNVLKENLQKQGFAWKDNPIAGGGGSQAMTVLRARVTSGNTPTAVQMLGFDIQDWAEQGVLADLTPIATKEGWDKVVPTALQGFSKYRTQVDRRAGQYPFDELDLGQQGGDGQDRRPSRRRTGTSSLRFSTRRRRRA